MRIWLAYYVATERTVFASRFFYFHNGHYFGGLFSCSIHIEQKKR